MAVKVLLVLAAILATATATSSAVAKNAKERDGRFIFSTHDGSSDTTSVTIGLSNIILGGLLIVGLIAIIIFVSGQNNSKELPTSYSEPSSYSEPAAEESYSIHRYIENAAERYDH